ncbi:DDE_Tnp_IS1595 domain-containing protein, partial [Durusdinium trenchii]
AYVRPSRIYTDGGSNFHWINDDGDYQHSTVIHADGEFAKTTAEGWRVSTNAVEGLFSLVKRMLRTYRAGLPTKESYGPYLAEFLFRFKFLRDSE